MYRDREPGPAPKQLNAARCRSSAGERSAAPTAASPAAYATRFAAEVGNRRPSRTGIRDALHPPASSRGPSAQSARSRTPPAPRPSPPPRTARPRSASDRRFAAEVVSPPLSGTAAGAAPARSASVCRFAAEGQGMPSRSDAHDASSRPDLLRRSTSLPFAWVEFCCTASVPRRAGLPTDRAPWTAPRPPERRDRGGRAGS